MGYDKAYASTGNRIGRITSCSVNNQLFLYILFILNILKFYAAGTRYFPLQDDFIQYWGYPQRNISYLFGAVGFFGTRPFAGLLDIFFWSNFRNFFEIALLIMSLLHFSSAVIFAKAFERTGIKCGNIFIAVYLFFPAGFEAVYWLSASTRIVTGLFFASLAVYYASGEKINTAAFFLLDLLAFGFYEQITAICFILCIWISTAKKRADIFICNISAAAVMGIYYMLMSGVGSTADRTVINIDLPSFAYELSRALRASAKLFSLGKIPAISAVSAVSALSCIFLYKENKKSDIKKLYMGLLIFTAALIPHLLSGPAHIPFRCIYLTALGLAAAAEYIAERLNAEKIFTAVFIFFALSSNIYQASVFSQTGRFNMEVCMDTAVNDLVVYRTEQKSLELDPPDWYAEYMPEDITKSDWAFTGAVRAWYRNIELDGSRETQ